MQMLDVRIHRVSDPEPPFPELVPVKDRIVRANFGKVAILEGGTSGGNLAISFFLDLSDGRIVFAELTESNLNNLAGIARGLRKRIDEGN